MLNRTEKSSQIFSQEIWNTLDYNEKIILHCIYSKGTITSKEASEIINRSQVFARRILKTLTEKKILVWNGSSHNDPAQYYSLNNNL